MFPDLQLALKNWSLIKKNIVPLTYLSVTSVVIFHTDQGHQFIFIIELCRQITFSFSWAIF
jgi:hypothetical protein